MCIRDRRWEVVDANSQGFAPQSSSYEPRRQVQASSDQLDRSTLEKWKMRFPSLSEEDIRRTLTGSSNSTSDSHARTQQQTTPSVQEDEDMRRAIEASLEDHRAPPACDGADSTLDDCLLYTSDAADEEDSVDLGGRRII
eukprot:TRINITY_DN15018_c0_g1_i2.p1 TRINITY_DN15018_c0_g1~~TRINITY_DN15018_c0_g1_i2.p1  ORF type:complete len:140 (-),score=28.38 TRINITY_DN15018_c0_g1_i2:119-538(-)